MAPSSDQASSSPTPTDPDLCLTPTLQGNPYHSTIPHLNNQPPPHQAYEQEMENLEKLWSGLSLEQTLDGTVSYVRIPVHPRTAMNWNQVTQTPSLPLRLDPPPHSNPYRSHRSHVRVHRSSHPYHTQARRTQASSVKQRSIPVSSSNADTPDILPAAIFRFLDRGEINIAMREDEPNLYIVMFSNRSLPFVVSGTHWARIGDVEALYRIMTTTARHQCLPLPTAGNPSTWEAPNESLSPFSTSMKMIAWNCQGTGNEMFRAHAYELHRRHRLDILIIIEPRIVDVRAQGVIDTLPYTHSQRVDPIGFSGGIWLLWNEGPSFSVEIITCTTTVFTLL